MPDIASQPAGHDRRLARLIPLCLILAGALAYFNSLAGPFIFDDVPWIEQNERIRSLSNLGEMLTATNRPLLEATLALNYAASGLNPFGYHLLNLIIHLLAGLTLYGLIRRTMALPRFRESVRSRATPLAGAIALLWLVHPLNTQSVTYLVQRGESMCGLFYLLSLYGFVRYADRSDDVGDPSHTPESAGRHRSWAAVAIMACWLGAGCKEVIATAPLVVLLYDLCFIAKDWREPFTRRWGVYLGLFAIWVPLAVMITIALSAEDGSAGFGLEEKLLSRWVYLITQAQVIAQVYLPKAIWPDPLVLDYGWRPAIPKDTPSDQVARLFMANVLWQGTLVVGLLLASVWGVIRRAWWGVVGLSFFLILAPTSSLVPIADLAVEHRMYLPLIAVVVAVVMGADAILRLALRDKAGRYGTVLVLAAAVVLSLMTVTRNYDYQSPVRLWDSVVAARPTNARGWHNLGSSLKDEGRPDEALACYEQVLKIHPDYAGAHYGIGVIWLSRGDLPMAIQRFGEAARLKPDDPAHHAELGKARLLSQDLDAAEASLRTAIELDPDYARAYEYLGLLHIARQQPTDAINAFKSAIQADPGLSAARQNLAAALSSEGRRAEAVQVLEEAIIYARQNGQPQDVMQGLLSRLDRYRAQVDQAPASP